MSQARSASSLRSITALTVWSTLQLLALFALHVVLARAFGASHEMDAYVAVQAVPFFIVAVVANPLGYVVIPVYNEQLTRSGEVAASRYLDRVAVAGTLFGTLLSSSVTLAADPLAALLYPGFSDEQHLLAVELLRIVSWLIALNLLTGFLHAAHHCRKRFQRPGIAGVVGPCLTVGLVVAFADRGIHAVAWAAVAGAVATDLLLLAGFLADRRTGDATPAGTLARTLHLLFPLFAGAAYVRLDPLVDRYLASGFPSGALSHLGYAWRLANAAVLIATGGLAVVVFPVIARLAAAGRKPDFAAELAHGWRLLCVVVLPIFTAVCLFSHGIVRDFFERGEFTAADTAAVARLLTLYAGVIALAAVGDLAARAFYALGDTRTPTLVGIVCFTAAVAGKLASAPRAGVEALAGLTSAFHACNGMLLLSLLHRRVAGSIFDGLAPTFVRSLLGTVAATAVGGLVLVTGLPFGALVGAACGLPAYVLVLWLLGDEFARRAFAAVGLGTADAGSSSEEPTASSDE